MKRILPWLLKRFIDREVEKPYTKTRSRAVDCALALIEHLERPEC